MKLTPLRISLQTEGKKWSVERAKVWGKDEWNMTDKYNLTLEQNIFLYKLRNIIYIWTHSLSITSFGIFLIYFIKRLTACWFWHTFGKNTLFIKGFPEFPGSPYRYVVQSHDYAFITLWIPNVLSHHRPRD